MLISWSAGWVKARWQLDTDIFPNCLKHWGWGYLKCLKQGYGTLPVWFYAFLHFMHFFAGLEIRLKLFYDHFFHLHTFILMLIVKRCRKYCSSQSCFQTKQLSVVDWIQVTNLNLLQTLYKETFLVLKIKSQLHGFLLTLLDFTFLQMHTFKAN